jgi:hypothetical protein
MRKSVVLLLIMLQGVWLMAQININPEQKTEDPKNGEQNAQTEPSGLDAFIFGTGLGAGAVISTNIVNSGALIPTHFDFLFKVRHHRFGFGVGKEFFLTPENLGRLVLNQTSNVTKGYLMYDWMLFKYSPINIGFGTKLGAFGNAKDSTQVDTTAMFGNVGIIAEIGIRKFSFYVRPELEYKSYGKSSLHKEVSAVAHLGVRFTFMTDEEKARLADRRKWRKRK